jgi:hypothetical protein
MTTHPIAGRLAVYLLLAAEEDGGTDRTPEVMDMAEAIAGKLSADEFLMYADEYDDSRTRWELSRAVNAAQAN